MYLFLIFCTALADRSRLAEIRIFKFLNLSQNAARNCGETHIFFKRDAKLLFFFQLCKPRDNFSPFFSLFANSTCIIRSE